MQISLPTQGARRAAMAAELLLFLLASAWIIKTAVADTVARNSTVKMLQLAISLAPRNSDYHLRLGRLYQYSAADVHPEQALIQLQTAVRLNPADPQVWIDLAAALEFQGNQRSRSVLALRGCTGPPLARLSVDDRELLPAARQPGGSLSSLSGSSAGTSRFDGILFDTAWKAAGNAQQILQQLIPRRIETEFSYLNYLISHRQDLAAQELCSRLPRALSPSLLRRRRLTWIACLPRATPRRLTKCGMIS